MTVAAPPSALSTLLNTLTASLTATAASLPTAPPTATAAGISLLDLKNDVFLSYLHHLSFLLLFRIRNGQLSTDTNTNSEDTSPDGADDGIGDELVNALAGLRIWLERGVKPCENRLKYQVEKVLKAAGEWERSQARKANDGASTDASNSSDDDEDDDGEEDDDDEEVDSDEEITSEEDDDEGLPKTVNYDSDDLSAPKKPTSKPTMKNALAYRPNPSLLTKPSSAPLPAKSAASKDGIYRPPKLNPVSMPEPTATTTAPQTKSRRREKAHAIDEYIASLPTAAPIAEPSIGSNVGRLGRTQTARERAQEAERTAYEEENFVRLPAPTKKEKARRSAGRAEWGGEDWRTLEGMGLDRIERLTKRRESGGGVLERSRKRGGEDVGRVEVGKRLEKRRKVAAKRQRR
ncbi:hypothetical protein TWF696_004583 [Orbilia brochopaga]|uniref:Uncharacterized protein n=1 Tax=Orbilia brochopaga TaxID=3140254 RepID=A0AAV9VD23_9PEZI